MNRRRFLNLFTKGAAVAVATPVVIGGLAEVISDLHVAPEFTEKMLMNVLNDIGPAPEQDFVVWTGRKGYDEINKAMKEFAMEQEHKMMYGTI